MSTDSLHEIFGARGLGLQPQGLRRSNERAVLTVVTAHPGVSNAEISRLSGLAPQTVSAILADIDRAGLITRGAVLRGRRGQPATPIFLRADGAFAIGVDIGCRHIEVLLVNLHGEVMTRRNRIHDYPDARTISDDIAEMVDAVTATLPKESRARLLDIGVALSSNLAANPVLGESSDEQKVLWHDLDLVSELGRRTGLEVSLVNDGNAACWAELVAFPRPRPASFIYFLISRHIAAGIIVKGMVWEGPTGNAANLGSMLVGDSAGGLQSAHSVASITTLTQRLAAAGIVVDAGAIDDWDWTLFEPVLGQWISDSAAALARVVFNTSAVIESELVVIDGILPRAIIDKMVDAVSEALLRLPVETDRSPQVLAGHLGALAPATGAAELTLYRRFFSRALADIAG